MDKQHFALDEALEEVREHRGSEDFQDRLDAAVLKAAKKYRLNADILIAMANRRLMRSCGAI